MHCAILALNAALLSSKIKIFYKISIEAKEICFSKLMLNRSHYDHALQREEHLCWDANDLIYLKDFKTHTFIACVF